MTLEETVVLAQHAVSAVALFTVGRVRVVLRGELAMLAALEILPDGLVALAAIHLLRDRLAGSHLGRVHFRVALAAGHLQVARARQLRRGHE